MEKHAYVPPPASRRRGPKSRQTQVRRLGVWFVGAKANNPSLNWFQDLMADVQGLNPRQRIELFMLFSNSPEELPRALEEARLDGVIIQGMEPSASVLTKLKKIPCVWFMTRRSDNFPGDYVEPNNEENGRMAARYLAIRGHKSVAVLTTEPGYSANHHRVEAFRQEAAGLNLEAHRVLGADVPGVSYLEISPLNNEIVQLVKRLLELRPCPTGIYIPSDHFAGAFFRTLRQSTPSLDHKFEFILGNYNPIIYNNLEHSPASIDINLSTLVRKVIDHLVWRIENPDSPGRIAVSVSPTLRPPEN
jgi:LacI family transcriptional regulator